MGKDGDVSVERSSDDLTADGELSEMLIFEQEPQQILDAIFPLYMNSTVLRALQESLASELAARMNAMNSASDNAKELKKNLTLIYNRGRQEEASSASARERVRERQRERGILAAVQLE